MARLILKNPLYLDIPHYLKHILPEIQEIVTDKTNKEKSYIPAGTYRDDALRAIARLQVRAQMSTLSYDWTLRDLCPKLDDGEIKEIEALMADVREKLSDQLNYAMDGVKFSCPTCGSLRTTPIFQKDSGKSWNVHVYNRSKVQGRDVRIGLRTCLNCGNVFADMGSVNKANDYIES